MKHYANISKVSGVDSYEYDSAYSYIIVKFKSGDILSYPAELSSVNQVRAMCALADLGIGLNRYLTANKPKYIKGVISGSVYQQTPENQIVTKVNYPTYSFKSVQWNNGRDWVQIRYKDGQSETYTTESTGKRNIINIIKYAIAGSGLKQYLDENKPVSVESSVE